MPLLLLLLGAVSVPIVSNAVDNLTEKQPKQTVSVPPATVGQEISGVVKWPLIIAGTIIAIKYGSKLIKKI